MKLNKKISEVLNTTVGRLVFVLLSGCGYFMLVAGPIIEMSKGMWILLMFFAPLIICGSGLVLIKLIKQAQENENESSVIRIFWLHICMVLIGIVLFTAMFV